MSRVCPCGGSANLGADRAARDPLLLEGVYSVTDPPIKALRRFIPPLRIGNFALDLSFILVMVAAYLLLAVVSAVFLG